MKSTKKTARIVFASNVLKHRKKQGLSQEELADIANLHRTYIGGVERGERNVSVDTMERIAIALKVSLPILLESNNE